jgi:hypothetical protein
LIHSEFAQVTAVRKVIVWESQNEALPTHSRQRTRSKPDRVEELMRKITCAERGGATALGG